MNVIYRVSRSSVDPSNGRHQCRAEDKAALLRLLGETCLLICLLTTVFVVLGLTICKHWCSCICGDQSLFARGHKQGLVSGLRRACKKKLSVVQNTNLVFDKTLYNDECFSLNVHHMCWNYFYFIYFRTNSRCKLIMLKGHVYQSSMRTCHKIILYLFVSKLKQMGSKHRNCTNIIYLRF